MKIKYYKATELKKPMKLAVHKSGKTGFPAEAEAKLSLSVDKSVGIGFDEENPSDTSLYMRILDKVYPDAYKISKAGKYYYLNTKLLFDNLKYDYVGRLITFEMVEVPVGEIMYYKLSKTERERKPDEEDQAEVTADDSDDI